MHRQSLGSPASKLQCLFSGTGAINNDNTNNIIISEDHRNDNKLITSSSTDKPQKPNPSSRLVHLIPILTFFCFLILYLFSHDPSIIDDDVGGGSMAIRSMRNLQQQERRRFHRKFRH